MRITIPDASDPDHDKHGETGEIVAAFEDDLGGLHPDLGPLDSESYTVELDSGGTFPARGPDLEPVE